MTPEEEQAVREAGPGWCSEVLWVEIWQLLDEERAKVEKLERVAEAARTIRPYDGRISACYGLLRGNYLNLLEALAALEATDE